MQLVRCRGVSPGESSITFRTGASVRILIVGVVCSSLRKCFFLVIVLVCLRIMGTKLYIFSVTVTLDDGTASF